MVFSWHIWLFTLHLGQRADLKKNVLDLNICWGLLDSWQGTTPPSSLRTARSRLDRHASKVTWESVKPREESSSMWELWIPKLAKAKNAHERKNDRDRQSTVYSTFIFYLLRAPWQPWRSVNAYLGPYLWFGVCIAACSQKQMQFNHYQSWTCSSCS